MKDIEEFSWELTKGLMAGGIINVYGEPGTLKTYLAKSVIGETGWEIPVLEGENSQEDEGAIPRQVWSWNGNSGNALGEPGVVKTAATLVVTDEPIDFYLRKRVGLQVEVTSGIAREALVDSESVGASIQRGVEGAFSGRQRGSGMSL